MAKTNFENGSVFYPDTHADKIWGGGASSDFPFISPVDADGHMDLLKGVADIRAYGADPTGVSDSTTAIEAALAACDVIIVPQGTFLVNDKVMLADGKKILGFGEKSILKITAENIIVHIDTDANCKIEGIKFLGNSTGSQSAIRFFTHITAGIKNYIRNCIFENLGDTAIGASDNTGLNYLSITGCEFKSCSVGVSLNTSSQPTGPIAVISNCEFFGCDYPIYVDDGVSMKDTPRLFSACKIYDGVIYWKNCRDIQIQNSVLDVDEYQFEGCEKCIIEGCVFPQLLNNTISNAYNATPSQVQWRNNRLADGTFKSPDSTITDKWTANIEGGLVRGQITGSPTVAAGASYVLFSVSGNTSLSRNALSNYPNQAKYTFLDGTNGRIYCRGVSAGLVQVRVSISLSMLSAAVGDYGMSVNLNGTVLGYLPVAFAGGFGTAYIEWIGEVEMDIDDYLTFEVYNYHASNSMTIDVGSYVEVEGL